MKTKEIIKWIQENFESEEELAICVINKTDIAYEECKLNIELTQDERNILLRRLHKRKPIDDKIIKFNIEDIINERLLNSEYSR